MKTNKILLWFASLVWLVVIAAAFTSGSYDIGLVLMTAPIVVPVMKGADISDSEKLAAELNKVFSSLSEGIKKAIAEEYKEKGAISVEDIDKKLKALGIEVDVLKDINEAIEKHGLELQKMAGSGGGEYSGLRKIMKTAFGRPGLAQEIEKAYSDHSTVDVTKEVANITTGNVTTDTGGNALLDMLNADEIMDIRLSMPFIEDYATTSSTSKPVYTYVDYIPGEGDVDFIAEGGTKPQLDLNIEVRTESPVKAAGYEILTEESITDIPRMESNARNIIFKKYLLKRQNGILFGDGLNSNPLGITAIAAAYNPLTWVADKVVTPNLHDVIIAIATQIFTTVSYTDDVEYYPNVAFINPADFAGLRIAKDKNGQYLFPSFQLFNDKTIDGIKIIAKNKIPAGKILMGDFKKLNIIDYVAYSVRLGWINDQFIKNLFTMLGEGRFFSFVKHLDQRAFVYDDIANVVAGIELIEA